MWRRVGLAVALVFVLYATAVAMGDGTVSFYPDLYNHDATLERVLGLAAVTRR